MREGDRDWGLGIGDWIGANIAEGYGRQSGKDQARFCEYALSSAREARGWYYQARHVLSETVAGHRIQLLTQITRLLVTTLPAERGHKMSEEPAPYDALPIMLLDNPPCHNDTEYEIRNMLYV